MKNNLHNSENYLSNNYKFYLVSRYIIILRFKHWDIGIYHCLEYVFVMKFKSNWAREKNTPINNAILEIQFKQKTLPITTRIVGSLNK